MKYLFFDCECSNCNKGVGKICEFGYVLTDENLKVLSKDDIPMSPGKESWAKFDLIGRKKEKDLHLAYDYDFYYAQPEFPYFYERIKKLMCNEGTICFAYSMDNDIRHVHNTCERYKKEPLNYKCYDVQKLVSIYLERKGQMNLEDACKEIVGPHSLIGLQEHLSRDDAMMEKLIFEAICELSKKTPTELLEESKFVSANSIEYMDAIKGRNKRKTIREQGIKLYRSLIATDEELDRPENKGKRYNVSSNLKCNLSELKNTIELIKSRGGLFSGNLSKTDYFIVFDEKNKAEIISHFRTPFNGEILTYQEFVELNK